MRKVVKIVLIVFLFIQFGQAQTIKDYKYLVKANVTDFIFMGRLTGEIEVPIFKNTSLTGNLGIQSKDYFYDIVEGTYNNHADLIFVHDLVKIFPSKGAFGYNVGIGIRQYFHVKTTNSKSNYIEIKHFYRKSTFNNNFTVYSYQDSGTEVDHVSGKQKLNGWYFALGRNNILAKVSKNKKMIIDMSFGVTSNFVNLNICPNDCPIVGWLADFMNQDDEIRDAWTAAYVGRYDSAENFYRFRAEIKFTFLKKKRQ